MAFKSEAHREKFRELVKSGQVSQKTFDDMDKETPAQIPQRLHPTRDRTPKRKRK